MICFRNCHFIALAVLLSFVGSWGACTNGSFRCSNSSYNTCDGGCGTGANYISPCYVVRTTGMSIDQFGGQHITAGIFTNTSTSTSSHYDCTSNSLRGFVSVGNINQCEGRIYYNVCDSQTESDSLSCVNGQCKPPIDSTVCDLARARCNKLGGVFEGHPLEDGCSSTCNTCGNAANKKILQIKSESCCAQNLAPSIEQMCQTLVQSGVGETYSTNANLECSDPSLSEEGASAYAEYCSGDYDWEENSSSGGEGGSSSSGGSSGEEGSSGEAGSAGLENDYYPILDTIRDTLIDIKRNVANIYTCLITPSACAGLSSGQKSGDTVIVNVPSDSVKLNDISVKLSVLDTSIHNSNDRLLEGISRGNDSLIDSMRKYLQNLESVGFSGDTLGDSLGRIHGTLEEIKGFLNGEEVDTSGVGSSWGVYIAEGERIGDSIGVASGWIGGLDTVDVDSVFASASAAASDSSNYDSLANEVDSALQHRLDSLYNRMKLSVDSSRSSLIDSMGVWAETLKVYAPFADFDSLIYNAIGAKIPNSDECPDNCQKWSLNLPRFGLINYTVDFGLCLGRAPLGGTSVLGFIRLLVRLVVVWTCIWFVIWNFTKRKGS